MGSMRWRGAGWAVAATLALGAAGCGGPEGRAERLYVEAQAALDRGDQSGALARFDEIVAKYPGTEAARKARGEATLYRGLDEAVETYPERKVRDRLVATARALYRHRERRGAWPESLDQLGPGLLTEPAVDPWGRPLFYRKKPRGGFLLASLGSDGAPGGEGEARDVIIEDGRFVPRPSEALP